MSRPRANNKTPPSHPFDALASLRGKVPSGKNGGAKPKRPQGGTNAPDADEDGRLFRATVGDVQALPSTNRAEIERPRPEPLPRRREENAEGTENDATPSHPDARLRNDDPLSLAYAGVTPLRDDGRALLDTALHATTSLAHDIDPLPPVTTFTDPAELFRHVVRSATPLEHNNRVELQRPAPEPRPVKHQADERAVLDESLTTPLSFEDRLDTGDEAAFLRPGLPRRILSDLRRGRWVLQGEIDLHGFTREEARQALADFLALCLQQGRRCIRVIHGKGLGSPGRIPILKQLSRGWLAQREEILAFCQAGPHDGGSGALLVLMRATNGSRQ